MVYISIQRESVCVCVCVCVFYTHTHTQTDTMYVHMYSSPPSLPPLSPSGLGLTCTNVCLHHIFWNLTIAKVGTCHIYGQHTFSGF